MIISTKGRYALRVMIDLAEHPTEGYTPLQEISDRQAISKEYLSSILKLLVEKDLLDSLRGKGGGYRLKYPPEHYQIGGILKIAEGDLAPVSCVLEDHKCPNSVHCQTHALWQGLDAVITDYLNGVTLADFLPGGRYSTPQP